MCGVRYASGEHEIELARRLLPNLRSFQAVEIDAESVRALRVAFQDNQLRAVETSVVETSLENWSGVDNPVDAVLLVNVLLHVHTADRKALFQKLLKTYLSPPSIVIIVDYTRSMPSGIFALKERLGMLTDYYQVIDIGFRVILTQDFRMMIDLVNPSDAIVKLFRLLSGHKYSEQQVRSAIDDIFSVPNTDTSTRKLAIFTR